MRRYPPVFCPCQPRSPVSGLVSFCSPVCSCSTSTNGSVFTTAQATDVLGCFIAATYLSPLLAGAFTDGRLGIVRVASLGYVVAATGYALLAAESRPTLYVYVGLTLVAFGAGAAKLAPSHLPPVCSLQKPGCMTEGLTLIYLLANVSALVSPVIGGRQPVRGSAGPLPLRWRRWSRCGLAHPPSSVGRPSGR